MISQLNIKAICDWMNNILKYYTIRPSSVFLFVQVGFILITLLGPCKRSLKKKQGIFIIMYNFIESILEELKMAPL